LILLLAMVAMICQEAGSQQWTRSDINNDGQVNLLDYSIMASDYLEPSRAWLIGRVIDLETKVMILETSRDIMQEKVKDFNWFLYLGEVQWSIDPNDIIPLYDPNYVSDYWWQKETNDE